MNDAKKKKTIKVCEGNACCSNFADSLFKAAKKKYKDNPKISIERCGCQARCTQGPVVVIETEQNERQVHTEIEQNDLDDLL